MSDLRGPARAMLLLCALSGSVAANPVFINEFHYDNAGVDAGEFVEIAGPTGVDLDGWLLLLYNGSNGSPYGEVSLGGVLGDDTGSGFGFRLVAFPANGLQNGAPDGLALLDPDGVVREFLSYEGVLVALDGAALGMVSRDVLVSESSATPLGGSLQRVGHGSVAADFVWRATAAGTPGAINLEQQFLAASATVDGPPPWLLWFCSPWWLAARRGGADNAPRVMC